MGLFGGISKALSSVGNVLGDVKDTVDNTWKDITPWNDNSEGAIGIGKITPWKESGNLLSLSSLADAGLLFLGAGAAGYGPASGLFSSAGGTGSGLTAGGIKTGGVTSGGLTSGSTLSNNLAASSAFSPTAASGDGLIPALSGAESSSLGGSLSGALDTSVYFNPYAPAGIDEFTGAGTGLTTFQKALLGATAANAGVQGYNAYATAANNNKLAKQQAEYNAQQQKNYDNTNNVGYTSKYDYSAIQNRASSDPAYYAGVKSAVDRIKAMRGQ